MKNEILIEKTPQQMKEIEKETRAFICPCCEAQLQFRVRVHVASVGPALTPAENAKRDGRPLLLSQETLARQKLLDEYADFLAVSKSLGVFDAFNQAVDTASLNVSGGPPNDREKYFLQWMKKAAKQNAPALALKQCLNGSASGQIEMWGWMNVSVIMQDGMFRVFIPRPLVHGDDIKELAFEGGEIITKKSMALPQWIKTKYGYVERGGEFANELRKHSVGAFGR